MKKILVLLTVILLSINSKAQESDFRMLAQADSTMILNILKGIEESDNVSIATMRVYKPNNGYQRIFIWWRIGGVKKDWTRGVITINKTTKGVVGYSIDSNRNHPKYSQLNDSNYISNILKNI